MDILPTIVDYLKIDTITETEGRSLMPLIRADGGPAEVSVVAESFDSQVFSIIRGGWKLVYNRDQVVPHTQYKNPYPIGRLELYDLERDRLEKLNLAKTDPERTRNLKALLLKYLSERRFSRKTGDKKEGRMTKEMEERLKTLGYL
jgi:arylsulfatase A-like enzyme